MIDKVVTLDSESVSIEKDAVYDSVYLDYDGNPVVTRVKFTPEDTWGDVQVVFEFNGLNLAGIESLVAFESVERSGVEIATHADIEDEDQTVYPKAPKIRTSASDKTSGSDTVVADPSVEIVDTVSYSDVVVGQDYKLVGVLMNKSTGEKLLVDGKEVVSTKTFRPSVSYGDVEVEFSFDASEFIQAQENTDVVVFEYLKQSDVDVATHTDIDDENQTFTIIPSEIGTTLTDKSDGDHVILPSQTITLTDHVTYTGLIVGKEYTLTGYLMNKDTGERLMINDREISATTTFTPNDTNGSVVIDFTFDASGLENGQEVVAFEYLSKNGVEVATHTDIEDKAQTVKVERSYESVIDKTGFGGSNGSNTPKTGDMLMWAVVLLCVLGAVSGGVVFARRRGLK